MERKNKVSPPEQKQSTQYIRQKTAKRLQRENLNITDYFRSRKRTKPDWIEDEVL